MHYQAYFNVLKILIKKNFIQMYVFTNDCGAIPIALLQQRYKKIKKLIGEAKKN